MKIYTKLLTIPIVFSSLIFISSCSSTDKSIEEFNNFTSNKVSEETLDEEAPLQKSSFEQKKQELESHINKDSQDEEKEEALAITHSNIPLQPEFIRRYKVTYLGIDVADLYLQNKLINSNQNQNRYVMRIYSKTNGFIDYLFGWRDYSVSRFRETDKHFLPESFETKLLFKKKIRDIKLEFTADGKAVESESVIPPDNRDKRPAVADNLKKHVFDPLSVGMEVRKLVSRTITENNFNSKGGYQFTLPIYEGRRRTDLSFNLSNKKVDGLYKLKISRIPVAGFTNNEMENIKKGDAVIDIYLDSKNLIPVKAEGRNFLGTAHLEFHSECKKSFEECIKAKNISQ